MVFISSEGLALDNDSAGFNRGWKSIGSFPVGPLTTTGCVMFEFKEHPEYLRNRCLSL